MVDASGRWGVIPETRPGASHRRNGLPNQDAERSQVDHHGRWAVAAVADGHGSRRCPRSDRGSKYAAEIAVEMLAGYTLDGWEPSAVHRDSEVDLPQRLVLRWRERVDADLSVHPFTPADLDALAPSDQKVVKADPRSAYGTTVVAALLTERFGLYLQLGDGDILVLSEGADEPFRPLPPDPRSFANETASLGVSRAGSSSRPGERGPWADVRVKVVPMGGSPPSAVLLTTDGYPNSFVNDAEFLKAAASLRRIGRDHGWDYIREELGGWLEEASEKGSGDDVTVALLVREMAPQPAGSGAEVVETVQPQPEGG